MKDLFAPNSIGYFTLCKHCGMPYCSHLMKTFPGQVWCTKDHDQEFEALPPKPEEPNGRPIRSPILYEQP